MASFFRRVLLFCSPFFILVLIYLISDPFEILYNYDNYNGNIYIPKNRDFISTEMYLKNSKKYIYDSFIFGASTAVCIPPSIWGKHIKTSNRIFSFDASGENIVGIWSKIKYVQQMNDHLKNALLVFDTGVTFGKFNNNIPVLMKHYKVYHSSKLFFHYIYFLKFLNIKFLIALVHHGVSNKFYPYMDDVLDNRLYYYDEITNEIHTYARLNELKIDSIHYYLKRRDLLTPRSDIQLFMDRQIDTNHIRMLKEINEIFVKDGTDFRIVITPLYNQIAFNKDDLRILQTIFGEKNIFDFSGINEFTKKTSNYYDVFHFKPYVGAEILDIVYKSCNK